ncbi:MAG TPA: hypothetical protein P5026_06945 [Kiritimatiellia bacterium]|nr:hypothetical protein [Kiritimatiellia bacterium]HRU70808.1 hypothetical protein [Kiritimatiellia bacterium]
MKMPRIDRQVAVGLCVAAVLCGCLSRCHEKDGRQVEVRVRQTPGGPRIHVDGKPIPPRFFGGHLAGSHPTGTDWREVSFDIAVGAEEAETQRIKIQFNNEAEFLMKEMRVTDLASGEDRLVAGSFDDEKTFAAVWSTYQETAPKRKEPKVTTRWTPEGVSVNVQGLVSGWWPTYQLRTRDGAMKLPAGTRCRCSFKIRSSARALVNVVVQRMHDGRWQPMGPPVSGVFDSQLKMARAAGIRLIHLQMPTCFEPPEKEQDWTPIDEYFRHVIAVVPDALIVPRVEADAPAWWRKRHPETLMADEDGSKGPKCTINSLEYRRDMGAHLEKLCRHLCEAFPKHFAGILPLGQGTYEWYYEKSQGLALSGYDPVTEQVWRQWQQKRGKTDADVVPVPAAALRHGAPNGTLRDPVAESDLIEFARFRQEQMADAILEFAAACRRGTDGKKLVLFFYGYLFEMGMIRTSAHETGHYALARVLASDDIDIVCAPLSYTDRAWSCSSPSMTVTESVHAAGKLWLNEDDCRTHLAGTLGLGGATTPDHSIAILRRNRGQALIRGFADWWLDIRDMGWHDDPAMWQIQHQLNPVENVRLNSDTPYTPQILAVVDEDSVSHLSGDSLRLAFPLLYQSRAAFGRCGAPYGQVLLDDVASGRFNAPLQVFLVAWSLTDQQREGLRKNRVPGTTRVWCHAPGYLRPTGYSVDGIQEVTGFSVKPAQLDKAAATPTADGKALLGLSRAWGVTTNICPLFSILAAPGDRILATFPDGSPALVLRETREGKDVFLSVPALTSELIHGLAKISGVHLYTETDAAGVWAHQDLASIHVLTNSSTLKVSWPQPGITHDLYNGKQYGPGQTFELPARQGETLLLQHRPLRDTTAH